ncbi:hypothetical protein Ddye_000636 [Dipteronia dyeriana]|uniref:RNase H type-1 domain-containing protein n=1 Tax=Dipteronia dyeriana TaxID=168575 RepID=A0AAD9XMF7_9ROSI|nr:hypothetical protein Ddye_000636 [Dipteronia dyeriana]
MGSRWSWEVLLRRPSSTENRSNGDASLLTFGAWLFKKILRTPLVGPSTLMTAGEARSDDQIALMLINIKKACVDSFPAKRPKLEAWGPPPCNVLKFNVDSSAKGCPGSAGILRDSSGKVICLFFFFLGVHDSNTVEILAIQKAYELCVSRDDLAAMKVLVTSDSKVAVSWVYNEDFGSLCIINIIYEIQSMLRIMGNIEVIYNSRSTNSFADMLAKKGSSMSGNLVIWS